MSDRLGEFVSKLAEAVSDQRSVKAAAEHCGVSVRLIKHIWHETGTPILREPRARYSQKHERDREVRELFMVGMTMQDIADRFGLSRERIRQILLHRFNLVADDGGAQKIAAERRDAKKADREERERARQEAFRAAHGISEAAYKAAGPDAARAFKQLRTNARTQFGTTCTLTFGQWWGIWQASGLWAQRGRGRGRGCWMRRHDRTKPYEVGNVYISRYCGPPAYDPSSAAVSYGALRS